MSIYQIIEDLRSDSSRLAKEKILKKEVNNDLLKKVIVAAYDPRISYFIKKIPKVNTHANVMTLEEGLAQLTKLSSRVHTGHEGIKHLTDILTKTSKEDGEVIKLIIDRDIKAGVSVSTFNKIWPELVYDVPYMRCTLPKASKIKNWNWGKSDFFALVQLKEDGMFSNVNVSNGARVVFQSRSGLFLPDGPWFDDINRDFSINDYPEELQFHGELLVEQTDDSGNAKILPREEGNGLLNSLAKTGIALGNEYKVLLRVWDFIPKSQAVSKGKYNKPYRERFAELKQLITGQSKSIEIVRTELASTYADANKIFAKFLKEGFEGVIIKHPDAIWKDGDNEFQVKGKVEFEMDLRIVGFNPGKNKNEKLFGSLMCSSECGKLVVNVSGMSDSLRLELHNNRSTYMNTIVTICGNNIMYGEVNSIFLPRLVELRADKTVADDMDKIEEQLFAAIHGLGDE